MTIVIGRWSWLLGAGTVYMFPLPVDGVASVDGNGADFGRPRACLSDSIAELEMVPNPDQRAPNEWSDDSGGESSSESDED